MQVFYSSTLVNILWLKFQTGIHMPLKYGIVDFIMSVLNLTNQIYTSDFTPEFYHKYKLVVPTWLTCPTWIWAYIGVSYIP